MIPARFLTRYYVLNACVILSYPVLRCFVDSPALHVNDALLGIPREWEIVLLIAVILFRKYSKAVTPDAFVSTCFLFGKTCVGRTPPAIINAQPQIKLSTFTGVRPRNCTQLTKQSPIEIRPMHRQ